MTRVVFTRRARDDIRPGLRYWISGSYLLLYRITDGGVDIVRAVHARRDLFGLFQGPA